MKENGLFRSIVNAVVQEEKKRYAGKPAEILIDEKKRRWYQIMNFIDELDAQPQEAENDAGFSNL